MSEAQARDIGEEKAKQAALEYFAGRFSHWPKGIIQSVQRDGQCYVVGLMPENTMGIINFFVTYSIRVNASTGVVEKMT